MNTIERKKIKRSANLRLVFFTFLGAFILFFVAFTYILPMVTPEVEIPGLTEDHVFDSITSHDFKGRVDPRLESIELQEELGPQQQKENEDADKDKDVKEETAAKTGETPDNEEEDQWDQQNDLMITKTPMSSEETDSSENGIKRPTAEDNSNLANIPPRPGHLRMQEKISVAPPAPVFTAKVVLGDFSSPKEAKMTSDILLNFNFNPLIRERNGKYIIQLGSFSDTQRASALVNELKNQNFDASIIYE
ncbi:MAG TPA: SPOR domain-containing protein [Candidatus Gastranaerophilales bacterium]|nr:SPOR domain-containing protein [Candidatus Gastranaerophilales bacterium]